jgi:hypothetical protein
MMFYHMFYHKSIYLDDVVPLGKLRLSVVTLGRPHFDASDLDVNQRQGARSLSRRKVNYDDHLSIILLHSPVAVIKCSMLSSVKFRVRESFRSRIVRHEANVNPLLLVP